MITERKARISVSRMGANKMIRYAIFCGNLQGSSYYRTKEEAQQAANFRTYCTGIEWMVREIFFP